jgi:hypothetical protein
MAKQAKKAKTAKKAKKAKKVKRGFPPSAPASRLLEADGAYRARAIAHFHARHVSRDDGEAHRLRGLARLKAATGGRPTKILRIEITNALSHNDYTARIRIGAKGAMANVVLDTGSSTLAVESTVYNGSGDKHLKRSTLMQMVDYTIGGWAGPVVNSTLTLGAGDGQVVMPNCPLAITSVQEKGNFKRVNGIMGLAYNGLNRSFDFKIYLAEREKASTYPWPFGGTWKTFSSGFQKLLKKAGATEIEVKPYFDQVEESGVVANKFAFYTLRSWVSLRRGTSLRARTANPLNRGYFILGGGEEQKDLYSGAFVTAKVLRDVYYNTNLKSVRVEGCRARPAARLQRQHLATMFSNSIVDSGTSRLTLAPDVFQAIRHDLHQLDPAFTRAIKAAADRKRGISDAALKLEQWPKIYFTLEGEHGRDVELACTPQTYWQTDYPKAGRALFQINEMPDGINQSILGLPLMNNYYTVFDRSQHVNGVIRFAQIRPPA